MKPTGNTVLVTGATSGIGLGLALRLHEAGNVVVVAGRRTERLAQIVAEHPGVESVVLDVTDPESIAAVAQEITTRFPQLNVLVNNAGVMEPEDLRTGADLATAERTVTTNLLGPIRLLAAFVPHLLAQESATIVNVTSGLAFVPLPATPTYSATKAAMHSFTDSLRVQLAGTGVRVVELAPPAVQTTLMGQQDDPSSMPLEKFLTEAHGLLVGTPDVEQVLVERVKPLRFAEANGNYDRVLEMLGSH